MTNELATRPELSILPAANREITPAIWTMIEHISLAAYKSRMYRGVMAPETAAMIILKGFELGIGPNASLELIVPIQGKYELIPRGALALLQDHPKIKKLEIKRLTDKSDKFYGYSCKISRVNGFEYEARFTLDDAKQAGLVKPDSGWAKYPENMCLWRAIGFAADVAAPDITCGMTSLLKMPEQYNVVIDDTGQIVEGQWAQSATAPVSQPVEQHPAITLDELMNTYGPDKVMEKISALLDGRMPANDQEVVVLADALKA